MTICLAYHFLTRRHDSHVETQLLASSQQKTLWTQRQEIMTHQSLDPEFDNRRTGSTCSSDILFEVQIHDCQSRQSSDRHTACHPCFHPSAPFREKWADSPVALSLILLRHRRAGQTGEHAVVCQRSSSADSIQTENRYSMGHLISTNTAALDCISPVRPEVME